MKSINASIKTAFSGALGAALVVAHDAANAQLAPSAGTSGGSDFGQIFRNLGNGLSTFSGLMEVVLYVIGSLFAAMTLFKLYKWNKSDGRDATLGGVGITFLVAVLGFTMPMLIGSGTTQMWGNSSVRTVSPTIR